jgi:hypothetical protein
VESNRAGSAERVRGVTKRAELETEAERVVSWLLVALLYGVFMCVVLAKPSSCFSHCWVDT